MVIFCRLLDLKVVFLRCLLHFLRWSKSGAFGCRPLGSTDRSRIGHTVLFYFILLYMYLFIIIIFFFFNFVIFLFISFYFLFFYYFYYFYVFVLGVRAYYTCWCRVPFRGVVRTGLAVCFDVAICSLRGALQTAAVLKLNEPRLHEVESYANYIS